MNRNRIQIAGLAALALLGLWCALAANHQSINLSLPAAFATEGGTVYRSVPSGQNPDPGLSQAAYDLSDPVVSMRSAVWFSDQVHFELRLDPPGAGGTVAVILGEDQTCIANLNDLGWPPDQTALDGHWAGDLDWTRVPVPGKNLPITFEYRLNDERVAALDAGTIDLVEGGVEIIDFSCRPRGEVAPTADLVFSATLNRLSLAGLVFVVFDTGLEHQLWDTADSQGNVAGDGVYHGRLAVPADLPFGEEARLHAEYRNPAGEVVATTEPVTISRQLPETYLVEFICEPSGAVELGSEVNLKAILNRADQPQRVTVYAEGPGMEHRAKVCEFDGREYVRGGQRLTGLWEGKLEWPYQMHEFGAEYRIWASVSQDGHIVSTIDAPPLILKEPELEILEVEFSDWGELALGQRVEMTARTNKPIRAGGLRLMINDERHGGLVDSGVHYQDRGNGYKDEVKHDGNWIGLLAWYSNPNQLQAGVNLPARLDYVFDEKVYATYELEPVTIVPGIEIMSMYQKPAGPVRLGDEVEFVIDLNMKVSDGSVTLSLADGTNLGQFSSLDNKGDRIVRKLNWKDITEPGDYGPVIARYMIRQEVQSEFTGEPLVVLPAQ